MDFGHTVQLCDIYLSHTYIYSVTNVSNLFVSVTRLKLYVTTKIPLVTKIFECVTVASVGNTKWSHKSDQMWLFILFWYI
jgi:hypothetical protein